MSDNRKYYYLKLKENYFDDDSIVLLESMQDGVLYSNILLKLYLKSLKHGGRLQLDENIPYTAQMIATITRQQIGTVERALQIFVSRYGWLPTYILHIPGCSLYTILWHAFCIQRTGTYTTGHLHRAGG